MHHDIKSVLSASLLALTIASPMIMPSSVIAAEAVAMAEAVQTSFRSEVIDGIKIAYREAGDSSKPTILLLHGFPTSSHMFPNLIPQLAENYHVIAPDYPGFGASDMPYAADYEYSFANTAAIIMELLDRKNVEDYAVYLMDYGAPVGFRMFAEHPERVSGFIIQNGNAYEEGLREFWDPLKAYWADPSAANGDQLRGFLEIDATKWQFTHGTQNPEAISPDNFWHVQYLLDRPQSRSSTRDVFGLRNQRRRIPKVAGLVSRTSNTNAADVGQE